MTAARQTPGAAAALIQRAAELIKTSANLGGTGRSLSELELIAEAVTAERERCAKIAEAWQKANNRRYGDDIGENIAAAIRNTP